MSLYSSFCPYITLHIDYIYFAAASRMPLIFLMWLLTINCCLASRFVSFRKELTSHLSLSVLATEFSRKYNASSIASL